MTAAARLNGNDRRRGVGTLAIVLLLLRAGVAAAVETPSMDSKVGNGQEKIIFEPSSSRLTADQGQTLDRLSKELLARGDTVLIVLMPRAADDGERRFVLSRLAVVERELERRGVRVERRDGPRFARGDDFLVVQMPAKPEVTPAQSPRDDARPEPVAAAELVRATPSASVPIPQPPIPTAPIPAKAPIEVQELWDAVPGKTMRVVLEEWGKRAGWTIIWQTDRDYTLEAPASFGGDFVAASTRLFEGFATAKPVPLGHVYAENRVLVVVSGETP
jgi:hypothetical protein